MNRVDLLIYLNECLKHARRFKSASIARTFYDQAFGAVSFYTRAIWKENQNEEHDMICIWETEYRPRFEAYLRGEFEQ
jgi:hypothetical protein